MDKYSKSIDGMESDHFDLDSLTQMHDQAKILIEFLQACSNGTALNQLLSFLQLDLASVLDVFLGTDLINDPKSAIQIPPLFFYLPQVFEEDSIVQGIEDEIAKTIRTSELEERLSQTEAGDKLAVLRSHIMKRISLQDRANFILLYMLSQENHLSWMYENVYKHQIQSTCEREDLDSEALDEVIETVSKKAMDEL